MNGELRRRSRNAMFGLALGDALSWPAMFHRSYTLPFWTRRIRREIDSEAEFTRALPVAMPFSLNRSAAAFSLGPTDDTEWAAFGMQYLIKCRGRVTAAALSGHWLELAASGEEIRGSLGVQIALENLRRKKMPPISGHDNPHFFDDAAVARAVPIGILCAGDPTAAAELAGWEAQITNAEDGLWAAQAMAAGISAAGGGQTLERVLDVMLAQLPPHSWINRSVAAALALCDPARSALELVPHWHETVINREYNYGNVAPETLALALALIKQTHGEFAPAIMLALTCAKAADSVPALVGALSGALSDQDLITAEWREQLQWLRGMCVPALTGVDFLALVEQLANLAVARAAR